MNELVQLDNNTALEVPGISPDLMARFLEWIDRSPATTKAYTKNLRQFMDWLDVNGIRQPQRADVIEYKKHLLASGYRASTVTAYLRNVKQLFAWASAEGVYANIGANVRCPKVDRFRHKKEAFTLEEVQQIEKNIADQGQAKAAAADHAVKDKEGRKQRAREQEQRLKCMYLLAVTCGLRTIELSRANICDLQKRGNQNYIMIWGKGRAEADQKKPVPAELAEQLREYITARGEDLTAKAPLFTSTGNRGHGGRLPATTISTMLKKAMQAAGYDSKTLTAHSLRHTAGTIAQELNGGNLTQTQEYMRHTDPATTEIYLHNKTELEQAALADRIYDYYQGREKGKGATLERIIKKLYLLPAERLEQLEKQLDAPEGA